MPDSLQPHLQPTRLLCPWDLPGKGTRVSHHFLLQGIFPTQGLNLGLLQCRQILYLLSYKGKMLHSISQQIWKTQQWPQDWKRSVFIPIPKKGNAKECSNYCTVALIFHASKVMLKILQARLQQYVNQKLPDVQDGFRKGRGTRDQIANIRWIIKKARAFQKNIYFCFIDYAKAFDCVNHKKTLENS